MIEEDPRSRLSAVGGRLTSAYRRHRDTEYILSVPWSVLCEMERVLLDGGSVCTVTLEENHGHWG